ncbi:TrmH family RNA methyltransferase [Agathobacter ruminis]|uniref:23S rRNA (Guanosine(2251)-2'-O)-methyltransferase RlmB n=1 Tax=Agathobacter ruminis TaxID=1712665 RepID=A0A2G3E0A9_9FIRM|nr:RNA methyltransferase [Agathobacter ruminis]MDC7300409.1 RNA methyltransferase [Agathobacter ruminis]PHU36717.1 23S rRNA (guanosine(2251)-2'-O)-methyltransferase RlmB [Agathobacter ruminis]
MITSKDNKHVKNLIALQTKAKERKKQNLFVVEGIRMVEETPRHLLRELYCSESFATKNPDRYDCEILSDALYKSVSDTQSPQGILAVVEKPHYELWDYLHTDAAPLFLVLEDIQDPGNLGTMMRTAEGAGATAVILSPNTVDLFNPKTIRSTMGSIYRLPYLVSDNLAETIATLQSAGVSVYAAHLKGKKDYCDCDYTGATAFLIGNEGNGLSDEIAGLADTYIRIPMEGQLESLNAAVSAALLMYECHRQR